MRNHFDIRDFGALPEAGAINTVAVQRAIDAANAVGGGTVYCPPGVFTIGTIWLRSHVTLHLEPGCRLQGSANPADYPVDPFPESRAFPNEQVSNTHLIIAHRAVNVTISGRGTIDGNGPAFIPHLTDPSAPWKWPFRPGQMIVFCLCDDVRVLDVNLEHAPYWTLFFHGCRNVMVRGSKIFNHDLTHNGDGIDIDCCREVCIDSCQISVGDDGITLRAHTAPLGDSAMDCENVVITNCVIRSHWNGIRVGVGVGAVRRCVVSNCVIHDSGAGINIISNYSANGAGTLIEDLRFADLLITAQTPIYISTGSPRGRVRNITLSDIQGRGDNVIFIGGMQESPIENITLRNIDLTMTGGAKNAKFDEQFKGNPEWDLRKLHVPCGLAITEARDIALDRVNLRWADVTGPWEHGLFARHTTGLTLSRVHIDAPRSHSPAFGPMTYSGCSGVRIERMQEIPMTSD